MALPEELALRASGVTKVFRLPHERVHTLKERVLHPTRGRSFERLRALDGVSFDVARGEFFGIVGRNGSGKSTLMKCLAGVYRPDGGEIWGRGRMAPFIELGVGFNPELTARDNVLINAVMLGLSPAQARARYDSIIAFAELEDFQDLVLKNYSSGMQVRLAFSVMVHVDADVLLIDEVLAVGDASFQQKCHDALADARRAGRTILLVTHDMDQVLRFCDRAMLLERGRIVEIGGARRVASRYMQVNFAVRDELETMPVLPAGDGADGGAAFLDVWCQDGAGRRTATLVQGESCALLMRVRFLGPAEQPAFGFEIADEAHRRVMAVTSEWDERPTGTFAEGDVADVWVSFDNWLAPGRYFVSTQVTRPGGNGDVLAVQQDVASVVVTGSQSGGGVVDIPHAFGWRVATRPEEAIGT
jgi:ABC-type polysaccharide/polyol phosphate transport system ATPase subunit